MLVLFICISHSYLCLLLTLHPPPPPTKEVGAVQPGISFLSTAPFVVTVAREGNKQQLVPENVFLFIACTFSPGFQEDVSLFSHHCLFCGLSWFECSCITANKRDGVLSGTQGPKHSLCSSGCSLGLSKCPQISCFVFQMLPLSTFVSGESP